MLENTTGIDIEAIQLTDEEKQERQQQSQQAQRQQLEIQKIQLQFQAQIAEMESKLKMQEEQNRVSLQSQRDQAKWDYDSKDAAQKHKYDMELLATEVAKQLQKKLAEMSKEALLEERANAPLGKGININ